MTVQLLHIFNPIHVPVDKRRLIHLSLLLRVGLTVNYVGLGVTIL